ncbi:MAG: PD-(D/E)XK nuclease family protein [Bacteroidales bacterium]
MKTFLDQVAEYAVTKYAPNASGACYVLPSRRAGLFLKKRLAAQFGKTAWAPSIFSVEDFIVELSGFKIIDPILLQFELFEVHKEIEGSNAQPFSEFLKWSSVMLNDFNEIDLYLADARQLFGDLNEAKAISLWNLDKKPLTEFEARYLHFFNSLSKYYGLLTKRLVSKKEVYQGLAYRKLAETDSLSQTDLEWDTFILAGFNALTTAEEKIFSNLGQIANVDYVWDTDSYYIKNKSQEAGKFLRKYVKETEHANFHWVGDHFKESNKEIHLLGVAQNVGQARLAGQLLKDLAANNEDLMNTAVVLNDQSIALPLLNSMDESLKKFNLTMGLPLSSTPLYRLISSVLNLHENSVKFSNSGEGFQKYYFRDVITVLEHHYIQLLDSSEMVIPLNDSIRKSNNIFLVPDELVKSLTEDGKETQNGIAILFNPCMNKPGKLLENIIRFFKVLQYTFLNRKEPTALNEEKQPDLDIEYLYSFSKVFNRLKIILNEYPFVEDIKTLRELFEQIVQSVSIPFYGEPLQGLQVMGMLETRTLDFENIIMLSVNEDFIPSGKAGNSFIPFEFRKGFQLPTHHDRNAVFAYHFYRLLQRSKKVHLIYNTEQGDLGGGGRSRFITQLLYEMPKYNPRIRIEEKVLAVKPTTEIAGQEIIVPKSKEVMERLKEIAEKGVSASALNSLRNCSLQYYFNYVARLEELEDVEETIEANTLGNVVHEVLKMLYEPYVGEILSAELISSMKPGIENLVRDSFAKNYEQGDIDHGKNLLIVKVAISLVNNFLDREMGFIKTEKSKGRGLILHEVEKPYEAKMMIHTLDGNIEVTLRGVFDRVDKVGEFIRILDYKSGMVNQRDLNVKVWEDLALEKKMDKSFQLLFYTHVYFLQNQIEINQIQPGIISMRNLGPYSLDLVLPEKEPVSELSIQPFSELIKGLIEDLFDPETPFAQTEELDNCKYCPYTSICNRVG